MVDKGNEAMVEKDSLEEFSLNESLSPPSPPSKHGLEDFEDKAFLEEQ